LAGALLVTLLLLLLQVRIVEHAFDIIHLLTDQNPIQIVVDAIINR
jgi:small subunit ribosomal protein S5e